MTHTVQSTPVEPLVADPTISQDPAPLGDDLAALLDRFTRSVTDPEAYTVGEFASVVGALQGELGMLAQHFSIRARDHALDEIDFDDIFPGDSVPLAELDPAYHGVMEAEELEHHCRMISR